MIDRVANIAGRCREEAGQALIVVMGVLVLLTVLPAALYNQVAGQLSVTTHTQWSQNALGVAQTAVTDYLDQLNGPQGSNFATFCSTQFAASCTGPNTPPAYPHPAFVNHAYDPATGAGTNRWEYLNTDSASDTGGGKTYLTGSGTDGDGDVTPNGVDGGGGSFQYAVDDFAKSGDNSSNQVCSPPPAGATVGAPTAALYATGRVGVNGHYSYRTIKVCIATGSVAPYAYGSKYEVLNPSADVSVQGQISALANSIAWARCNILGYPNVFNLGTQSNATQATWCDTGTTHIGVAGEWGPPGGVGAPANAWDLCNLHSYDHTTSSDPHNDGDGNDTAAGGGDHDADDYNYNVLAATPASATGPALGCQVNRFYSYRSSGRPTDSVTGPVYTNDQIYVCGSPKFGTPSGTDTTEPDGDGDDTVVSAGKQGVAGPIDPLSIIQGCTGTTDHPTFNGSASGSTSPPSPVTGTANYSPLNPMSSIAAVAHANGCTFSGPTAIRFHAHSTADGVAAPSMTVLSPQSSGVSCGGVTFSHAHVPQTISLSALSPPVVYVANDPGATGCQWNWNYWIQNEGKDAPPGTSLPPCGAGDAIVGTPQCNKIYSPSGTHITNGNQGGVPPLCASDMAVPPSSSAASKVADSVTIGAQNDVWITSNLVYATNGGTQCTGSALNWTLQNPAPAGKVYCPYTLVLAAGNNVQVNHPLSFGAFACGFSAASGCSDTNTTVVDDESSDTSVDPVWGTGDESGTSIDANLGEAEAWSDSQCDGAGNPALYCFNLEAGADATSTGNTDVTDGTWTDNACDAAASNGVSPGATCASEPDGDENAEPAVNWSDNACDAAGNPATVACDTGTDALLDLSGIGNTDTTDPVNWTDNACDANNNPGSRGCNPNEPPGGSDGDGEYQIWTGEPGISYSDNACDQAGNPVGSCTLTDALADSTSTGNSDATDQVNWTENACDAAGNPGGHGCNPNEGPGSQDGDETYQVVEPSSGYDQGEDGDSESCYLGFIGDCGDSEDPDGGNEPGYDGQGQWVGEPGVNWDDNACDAAGNPGSYGGLGGPCYPSVPGSEASADGTGILNTDLTEPPTNWTDNTCDFNGNPTWAGCNPNEGPGSQDGDEHQIWTGEPGIKWDDNACDSAGNPILKGCDTSTDGLADGTSTGNSDAQELVNWTDNACDAATNPGGHGCAGENDGDENVEPQVNWDDNACDMGGQPILKGCDTSTDGLADSSTIGNTDTCGDGWPSSCAWPANVNDQDNDEDTGNGTGDHDSSISQDTDNDGDSAANNTDAWYGGDLLGSGDKSNSDDGFCDGASNPVGHGCAGENDGDDHNTQAEPAPNWCSDNLQDAYANGALPSGTKPPTSIACNGVKSLFSSVANEPDADNTEPALTDQDNDGDAAGDTDSDPASDTSDNSCDAAQVYNSAATPAACASEPDGDEAGGLEPSVNWTDNACDAAANPSSDGDTDGDGTNAAEPAGKPADSGGGTNTYDFGCSPEPDADAPAASSSGFTWDDNVCDAGGNPSSHGCHEPDGDDSSAGLASECTWYDLLTWGDCLSDAGDWVVDFGDGSPPKNGGMPPWWSSIVPIQDAANPETPYPSMTGGLTVDAAIFAPKGSFDLAMYRFGGAGMGTLTVNGSISQDYAGPVGISYFMGNACTNISGFWAFFNFCTGLPAGTTALVTSGPTGYSKNFVYDSRLASAALPGVTAPAVPVSWQELKPGAVP